MIDSAAIARLFAWFERQEIVNKQGYSKADYLTALKDLDEPALRTGCEAMSKAQFKAVLFAPDFKRLCDGSWKPSTLGRRTEALREIRQILGRHA